MLNNKIIKICEQKLIFLNYSNNTKNIYIHYIKEFISSIEKQVVHLNSTDFQNYIDNYKFTSISQQNQVINSIRFLYKFGLDKKYDKVSFTRPKKEKKLPQIIESEFLKEKINQIRNLKHKSIISLGYSVGLRVSHTNNVYTNISKRCPYCNESHGEKEIMLYLEQKKIKYERQKTFIECKDKRKLPFDFYLPEYNMCVEFDGEQHFRKHNIWGKFDSIKKHDKIKNEYCFNNNIHLIRIKFDENIKEI
jgi:site-specific recombinase XerD